LGLLLGLIQSSTSLLPVLVVTEMISETKLDSGLRLGPLVRIFRWLLTRFAPPINQIVDQSFAELAAMNHKQQGVLPRPTHAGPSGKASPRNRLRSSIGGRHSAAQLVLQELSRIEVKDLQLTIQVFLENRINKPRGSLLRLGSVMDVTFTFFPIFPKPIVSYALTDLERFSRATPEIQSPSVSDFFRYLHPVLTFLSSPAVVVFLIGSDSLRRRRYPLSPFIR
jgi:hypothetical protein